MHYAVTGATGFVGRHVVTWLLAAGHHVTVVASGRQQTEAFAWAGQVDWQTYRIDAPVVTDNLFQRFGQPDKLIHLAWPDVNNPTSTRHTRTYLLAQNAFLTNLVEHGLPDLTVAGSCFEYGLAEGCLTEDQPLWPTTPYGVAKNVLHQLLTVLTAEHNIAFRWLRLFYMYGDGQHERSLFQQLEKAVEQGEEVFNMSGGEQLRDYLPVGDMAALIGQLANQQTVVGAINCGSGIPTSVRRLVEQILTKAGATIQLNLGHYPYRSFEPMASWASIAKLRAALSPAERQL